MSRPWAASRAPVASAGGLAGQPAPSDRWERPGPPAGREPEQRRQTGCQGRRASRTGKQAHAIRADARKGQKPEEKPKPTPTTAKNREAASLKIKPEPKTQEPTSSNHPRPQPTANSERNQVHTFALKCGAASSCARSGAVPAPSTAVRQAPEALLPRVRNPDRGALSPKGFAGEASAIAGARWVWGRCVWGVGPWRRASSRCCLGA